MNRCRIITDIPNGNDFYLYSRDIQFLYTIIVNDIKFLFHFYFFKVKGKLFLVRHSKTYEVITLVINKTTVQNSRYRKYVLKFSVKLIYCMNTPGTSTHISYSHFVITPPSPTTKKHICVCGLPNVTDEYQQTKSIPKKLQITFVYSILIYIFLILQKKLAKAHVKYKVQVLCVW